MWGWGQGRTREEGTHCWERLGEEILWAGKAPWPKILQSQKEWDTFVENNSLVPILKRILLSLLLGFVSL